MPNPYLLALTRADRDGPGACQRVGAFRVVPGLIRAMGGDPEAVLQAAGVDPSALDHPDSRIPYPSLGRLLAVAAKATGCAHFGLACGQAWQLRDLGVPGRIARHAATVGDALRSIVIYQRLNSGGGVAYLVDHDVTADFGYAIYHPGIEGSDQVYAAVLAGGFNFLRELCGGISPVETLLLPHARPRDAEEYRRHFRCHLRFDVDRAAMRFRSDWLARPVEGADAAKRRALEDEALQFGPGDFLERVVRSLRSLLIAGRHSGDDVAQSLALHRRTFNRRLKAQGTNFQEVLDGVRFEVSRQLLAEGEIPMDEVALSLGYSGLSSFQRSFRRWSGSTPGQWRRASKVGGARTSIGAGPA